jgi:glyoxylase-like metal-dependent hydrolase (beta-lactamase superfamily II)
MKAVWRMFARKAIERDTASTCFACGRGYTYRGPNGDDSGRYCSARCRAAYDAGFPRYEPLEEIIPGVHAMLAPGHTVGHTIFMIDSGGKQLSYVADLAHHPVLLLQKPLTEFKYDTDPGCVKTPKIRKREE